MASPCTVTLEDGTHYDLSSLASATADYVAEAGSAAATDSVAAGSIFKLNVCRAVVSELWNVQGGSDSVAGFVNRPDGDFSLGSVSTNISLSPGTNQPVLILQNGSPCPSNPTEFASTAIRFVCNQAEYGAGTPRLVAALPPGDSACHFFFDWQTHVACATSPRAQLETSHVVAFVAFIGVAILTWFGGHTIYNRCYLGRRGLDQFPLPRFSVPSVKLPSLSRKSPGSGPTLSNGNGVGASARPRWGMWGRRSQRAAGYNHLRADDGADEEDGLAGARFSLDDDEFDEDEGTEDARALGGELHAWRAGPGAGAGPGADENGSSNDRELVGVHQGLVDI